MVGRLSRRALHTEDADSSVRAITLPLPSSALMAVAALLQHTHTHTVQTNCQAELSVEQHMRPAWCSWDQQQQGLFTAPVQV